MAEPLAILGGVASIIQIISNVTKLAKSLNEVREKFGNVALNTTLVASQLATIRAALEAIHTWRASDTTESEASKQLDQDLGISLSCCAVLITVIDSKLKESGYQPEIGMKEKVKYLWLEGILKEYVSNLEGQIRALQLLLTVFQCKTATEQKQQLAQKESRIIIEHVRAETMSLYIDDTDLEDAISILSRDPSVRLDVDSVIMRSPAYRRVYGNLRSNPARKHPEDPPAHRRKPVPVARPHSSQERIPIPHTNTYHESQRSSLEQPRQSDEGPSSRSRSEASTHKIEDAKELPLTQEEQYKRRNSNSRNDGYSRSLRNADDEQSVARVPGHQATSVHSNDHIPPAGLQNPVGQDSSSLSEHDVTTRTTSGDWILNASQETDTESQTKSARRLPHGGEHIPNDIITSQIAEKTTLEMADVSISTHPPSLPPIQQSTFPLLLHHNDSVPLRRSISVHSGYDLPIFEPSIATLSTETAGDNTQSSLHQSASHTTATSAASQVTEGEASHRQTQTDIHQVHSELAPAKAPKGRTSFMQLSSVKASTSGSALCDAASRGDLASVKALLEAKANINFRGNKSMTPLMLAAINGHQDVLQILKDRGADELASDTNGRNALHLVVANNQLSSVEWLLKAYPPDQPKQSNSRGSLLSKAKGSLVGRSSKNLREASDAQGLKALHIAAETDKCGVIDLLLAAGVNVESQTNCGWTPLHQAIVANRLDSVDNLLRSGANLDALDTKSMTVLHLAAKEGDVGMVKTLIARGAGRHTFDDNGCQPIHSAAWAGRTSNVEALVAEPQDLATTMDSGKPERRTGKGGITLLYIAAIQKNHELAKFLLKNGVDVNPWSPPPPAFLASLDNFKVPLKTLTPLHIACCNGDFETASALIDYKGWVNAATLEGVTLLMMAVESEDTNTVNLLLSRGAKVNASMPRTMLTALHIASRRGDLETVHQLCLAGANPAARYYQREIAAV
ncbi:uncharacterized protein KY384_000786 [Bacidia gigantensis]|uniref:uncharacterized protein n=1 Tax=Bacidia gigantensis TaxID=2732470 RepID=UPI001D047FFC|nr:uncharacterized protein KY384_000786 [Bacidia gigantensis]KAG8526024.1 hypothetical protein KY384_000786 [Bacidia gigantensis]